MTTTRLRLWSVILAIALTIPGCSRPEKPEEVYRNYLDHLVHGRVEEAYELLTPATRGALARSSADPDAARPGLEVFRRAVQTTGDGRIPLLPEDSAERVVGVRKIEGSRATLEVKTPLGTRFPTLERVQGHWRVSLALPSETRGR